MVGAKVKNPYSINFIQLKIPLPFDGLLLNDQGVGHKKPKKRTYSEHGAQAGEKGVHATARNSLNDE